MSPAIPYESLKAANSALFDELETAASRVIRSGWYVLGEEVSAFEREFAAWNGNRHCIGVANGLDAIILSIEALAFLILGGLGSIAGAILGAVFLSFLPEAIRLVMTLFGGSNPTSSGANLFEIRGMSWLRPTPISQRSSPSCGPGTVPFSSSPIP